MPKKIAVTKEFIKQDIVYCVKHPRELSKAEYNKGTVPTVIALLLLVIVDFIYPILILWEILVCFVCVFCICIINSVYLHRKAKKVSVDDYEVGTEVVSYTSAETYRARITRYRTKKIENYTVTFESGDTWVIPRDNYRWSTERPMSSFAVYQDTQRGDLMIVVRKKDSREIVTAYSTKYFVYNEDADDTGL